MGKAIFLFSLLVFFIILDQHTAVAKPKKPMCSKPSQEELLTLLDDAISILNSHFTCLAVRGRDVYQSASVVIQYNTTQGNITMKHFELECNAMRQSWSLGTSLITTNSSLFKLTTRYDCYKCVQPTQTSSRNKKKRGPHHHHSRRLHKPDNIDIDEETHCRECNEACHGWGGGHCKSPSVGSCCPYFDSDGVCTQECPSYDCAKCSQTTCYNGGTLDNSTNCTSCICPPGYTSTLCDVQICTLPCQNNGTCVLTNNGTMYCNCTEGYTGTYCEETIIEPPQICTLPCLNNGTCIITNNGTMYCNCTEGYTGSYCEETITEPPTTVNPCKNGGTLTADGQSCICPPEYTGRFCEDSINETCPCLNGGTCSTIGDGLIVICICPDGWSGEKCEYCTNHPACTPSPTRPAPLEETNGSNIELIIAVVLTVIGALVILSLLSLFGLLYAKYRASHKDQEKVVNPEQVFDGDKVIVNPVYMKPGLLASGTFPTYSTEN